MWPPSPKTEATSTDSTASESPSNDTSVEGSQSDLPDEIALPGPAPSEESAEPIVAEASSDAALTEPATASEQVEPVPAPTAEAESEPSYPVWPSFPSYSSTDNQAAPAWYAQDFPSDSSESTDSTETDTEQHVDDVPVSGFEPAAPSRESESDPIASFVGRYGSTYESTSSTDNAVADAVPEIESDDAPHMSDSPTGQSSESLERAQTLLAELGALLPTLASGTGAVSTDLSSSIAESLAVARSDDETEFDALVEAVAAVRARPRDIDVVLELARHVDAIVDLKDRYDQAQAAIDVALSRLGTE